MKKFKIFSALALSALALTTGAFLTACGGVADGTYTENGLIFKVENQNVYITGAEEGATEVTIPAEFKNLTVYAIEEEAFKDSAVTKISFEEKDYRLFSIGVHAFDNSAVKEIINLPANVTMGDKVFSGLKNLEKITVYGTGDYYIENGNLIKDDTDLFTDEEVKILVLAPANMQPTANFDNGTYTITGVDEIYDYAFDSNKYITDIIIEEDVKRIESYAFQNVVLNSVTIKNTDRFDIFIDGTAFYAHKDLKIYVPATTNSEMNSWLGNTNFLQSHNWLIHPESCTRDDMHMHGLRSSMATGSIWGYDYSLDDDGNMANIKINSSTSAMQSYPDYMK